MTITEKFGLRLKTLRKEKGLSQEELAERSGLNRPYISGIEQGKRNVSLEVMEKLAEALGVEMVVFFEQNFTPSKLKTTI
jgi:transcriptional regulator with XRE-family HTH domain